MFLIGAVIGGIIGIFILKTLFEWAIFKRVMNDPVAGKLASVGCAYLAYVILWTVVDQQSPLLTLIVYFPGALLWSVLGYLRGIRTRAAMGENLSDVFE